MRIPPYVLESTIAGSILLTAITATLVPNAPLAAIGSGVGVGSGALLMRDDRKKRIAEIEAQLQEAKTRAEEFERGAAFLEDERDRFSDRLTATLQELEQHKSEGLKLCEILDEYKQQRLELMNDIALVNAKLVEATTQNDIAKQHWQKQYDELLADYNTLDANYQSVERELLRYKDSNAVILELERTKLAGTTTELEKKLMALKANNEKLEAHAKVGAEIVGELRTEFEYLSGEGYEQLEAIHKQALTQLEAHIQKLEAALEAERKPLLFEQTGDMARADKLIAELVKLTGVTLDAGEITPIDDGAIEVALNVRDRKARGVAFTKTLSDLGEVLQVELACIEPLSFKFDPQNPHRILTTLRYRKPPAKAETLPWKTVEQFESLASKWERVRITGGSESGKSPLAELVVGAMQKKFPAMRLLLAFPIEDSTKNHWSLNVTHTSLLAAVRQTLKSPPHTVCVLDEVDTALEAEKELAPTIKELLKTGSHKRLGCVLVGQNANVRQWKGFDRSDFENCVNVHIGSASYHAISNSNNLTSAQQEKLKAQADKLTAHCEKANADSEDNSQLKRFALVVEPSKQPYWIQLPPFGSISYDYRLETQAPTVEVKVGEQVSECPHCGSQDTKANGGGRRKCKSCGKTFKA